jgi:hypothetical protein
MELRYILSSVQAKWVLGTGFTLAAWPAGRTPKSQSDLKESWDTVITGDSQGAKTMQLRGSTSDPFPKLLVSGSQQSSYGVN